MKTIITFLSCVFLTTFAQAQSFSMVSLDPPYPYYDGHKWGITNWNRQVVVAPQYDNIRYIKTDIMTLTFSTMEVDTFALVEKNRKEGIINLRGQTLIPFNYDRVEYLYWAMACGKLHGKYALLDLKTHKQLTPAIYDSIADHCACEPKVFKIWQQGKQGFINADSLKKPVILYDKVSYFEGIDTVGLVIKNKKYGLVSLVSGNILLPIKYDKIIPMSLDNERATVVAAHSGNMVTYFDRWWEDPALGNSVKDLHVYSDEQQLYEHKTSSRPAIGASDAAFHEITVHKLSNNKWQISDEDQMYDPPKVNKSYELNGFSSVQLLPNEDRPIAHVWLLVYKEGKAGIIKPTGEVLVPFIYDKIERTPEFYKTTLNGKIGILDLTMLTKKTDPVLKSILLKEGKEFEAKSNVGRMNGWLVELPDGKKGFMIKGNGRLLIP